MKIGTGTKKEKYIWNMMGSLTNALSSMVLSVIVNRISGADMAGVFAFAFSNAQLMMTIAAFEVRPLQSTDIQEHYSFSQYFTLRVCTCILMMMCNLIYIGVNGYTGIKAYTLFFVGVYKMIESFADVFGGMYQQHDRIDLSGKAHTYRVVSSTVVFFFVLLWSHQLVTASVSLVLVSLALFFLYDFRVFLEFHKERLYLTFQNLGALIRECLPLFLSSFIMMYINNAPKYAIDTYCSDKLQNIYNILFMPAFVINLFSLFIFRPMLVELTELWNQNHTREFMTRVRNLCLMIGLLTICAIAGAALLGIPVLQFIYGVKLDGHKGEFLCIMGIGGISALSTFLYYMITVMRKQKLLLLGYGCSFLVAVLTSGPLVKQFGIFGAVASCGSSLVILVVVFAGIMKTALYNIDHMRTT